MEGLQTNIIVVGAIYVVFIILFNVYKAKIGPRSMRSARTRSVTADSVGYATTQAQKMDARLGWARLVTTLLVILSFILLVAVMWFNAKGG